MTWNIDLYKVSLILEQEPNKIKGIVFRKSLFWDCYLKIQKLGRIKKKKTFGGTKSPKALWCPFFFLQTNHNISKIWSLIKLSNKGRRVVHRKVMKKPLHSPCQVSPVLKNSTVYVFKIYKSQMKVLAYWKWIRT